MKLLHSGQIEELCADLNRVVFQVKQPEMFVTFAAMRFGDSGQAEYVLAGHPSILHYVRATGQVLELESTAPPLGVLEVFPFGTAQVQTSPGDLFVVLTDGLIEMEGEWDPRTGMERIKKILLDTAHLPVEQTHARILHEVRNAYRVDDDQTLLLARVN
jgi:serine phosphatase RsbU (regulator of sigma subunit)